ncbi:MAG TPA: enoyl-CoA hydratase/isomerase family protein [Chitinivibrionales bacterium]|jgi:enoyl-CoA hydratase/carnithine racemase|nr:enoyl-CoA hydratase/isomerase family protein [Chitinivibrionales bacterium]
MAECPITLHRSGPVAFLVLSAPPKNEMGAAFFGELSRIVPALAQLPVKGMIVRGAGRHFSSGANLSELRAMLGRSSGGEGMRTLIDNSESLSVIASLPFPSVAAIRGCCLGSGLELALACRYRIAERNAVLGLPEASFGLMPGCGGTVRLTRLVGYGKAMEMILTGASMLASDAQALGIVDAVVDKSELEETAKRFVERLG